MKCMALCKDLIVMIFSEEYVVYKVFSHIRAN